MLKSIEKQAKLAEDLHENMDSFSKISSKMFMSRSRLNLNQRHLREEHQIEQTLKKNGWRIYTHSRTRLHIKKTLMKQQNLFVAQKKCFSLILRMQAKEASKSNTTI